MMTFKEAYILMKQGAKVKLPEWEGYWFFKNGTIMIHCSDGKVIDIRETDNVDYTMGFILREEWEVYDPEDECPIYDLNETFGFDEAIRRLHVDQKLARKNWNGKGQFVVRQKGYPNGIPCNVQTAKAWGMSEGDLFKCEPYYQIRTAQGSHAMWVPSITDIMADDWYVVKLW